VRRTPVVFIHGNNNTPFPTACNPFGSMQALAQFFADSGYSTAELWGIGCKGDQCDLGTEPTRRSSIAHTNAANVPDPRRLVAIDGPNHGIINCSPNPANSPQTRAAALSGARMAQSSRSSTTARSSSSRLAAPATWPSAAPKAPWSNDVAS